jgi:hypothetical protein
MPNWTGSVNKTSQGLVRGISFGDSKPDTTKYRLVSTGSTGWKEALNSTGSGLLRGVPPKKEKSPTYTPVSQLVSQAVNISQEIELIYSRPGVMIHTKDGQLRVFVIP